MQTIDRMMLVIHTIANIKEEGITISELSKNTELPLATLHRILSSLMSHKLIEQDSETKKYTLGNQWLEYGLMLYDSFDYVSTIRPELDRLANIVNESVYLNKPLDGESLIMERIDGPNNRIHIVDQIGLRVPMPEGAANKVMLANFTHNQVLSTVSSKLTEVQLRELIKELQEIRAQDLAISYDEHSGETASLAAAVFSRSGEVIGAVSIGVLQYNLTSERIEFLKNELLFSANNISQKLGFLMI